MHRILPSRIKRILKRIVGVTQYARRDPNWYKSAVGGLWEEIGKLQFGFLVEQGVRPEHYFLDVGCGSIRGGLHFIRYLEAGHYFGIDISQELLDAGRAELERGDVMPKHAVLMQMDNFDFPSLGQQFDYAIAQSVFTHLPLNSIIRCILNIEKVLVPGGRFYATFFENPGGKFNLVPVMHPQVDGPDFATFLDKDPYHYEFQTFEWICEGTSLSVEYLGDWDHPRDQKMMVFVKKKD